ncbi:MAG TPA: glucuronate isomerase [Ruminococcaceae bacterium]|nr:glucuronate isomerase [Oscillospiraceae bacterium]
MGFIHQDFMLRTKMARRLYHEYAEDMPIIDYHCHLNPQMIAENHQFKNLTELLLGGDHYKWRVMRAYGIDEKYITGDADDYEKFKMWAETLPHCIGNPLYHWTHLELKRYFNIGETLTPDTAQEIWQKGNDLLGEEDFRARSLITRANVEVVCTTDDPADDLNHHQQLRQEGFEIRVLPTFRPDKAVEIGKNTFVTYVKEQSISSYEGLQSWLRGRIGFFHENGCRLSDHALEAVPYAQGDAKAVFDKAMAGQMPDPQEQEVFKTAMLQFCAKEYAARSWTMQLHIGALRNNNTPMFEKLGPDTGYDSVNDLSIAAPLARLLDSLETDDMLPKTILYTLNPKDNYVLGTMIGNFQKAPFKGKVQLGSGWWFNDQRDGMVAQMKAFANLGVLGTFVGMLTDSRSFVSYPRHEYFRRILCNLIGGWVEHGEYPEDYEALGDIIQGICYKNAKEYFGF